MGLDTDGTPNKIRDAGVRVFNDGRDVTSKATLKATRRENRSARRRRDRFIQRQIFLLDEMTKAGLFPTAEKERKEIQKLNPLKLRALALHEKLHPYHTGRALFHLNQRRGFKSNRKDKSKENTSGKISNSVRGLLEQMQLIERGLDPDEYKKLSKEEKRAAREYEASQRRTALDKLAAEEALTYGTFLWGRHKRREQTRARASSDGKLYEIYPTREILEDEFGKIWQSQAIHYPDLMSDTVRERIHHAIFSQRPLKLQDVGKCSYLQTERRTFRAMPSFQCYRIYQEVSNLYWTTSEGHYFIRDYPEVCNAILDMLEKPTTKRGEVSFNRMKTVLKRYGVAEGDFHFNFETEKRKGFEGNLTSNIMQGEDYVGLEWHDWTIKKQDDFIAIILDENRDDEEVCRHLIDCYSISEFSAVNCMNAPLLEGTAKISLKAARLLYEKMRDEMVDQARAVEMLAAELPEFKNPFIQSAGELLPKLPYYGEVFQGGQHIITGTLEKVDRDDDLKYFGGVTNPTVHIALNQIRYVINELIDIYGHPASISIELGRNLPLGQQGRNKIDREQRKNQQNNKRWNEILLEHGQTQNRDNRLRLRLWEELNKEDCMGRCCPFSGALIGITDLFSSGIEVEHLIPFSISLDDSNSNKVLCTRKANVDKGNKTPFQAFGSNPDGYSWHEIYERVKHLPRSKQWRFQEDALEIWMRGKDFTERHLNDTRYIGRMTKEYLKHICPSNRIDIVAGRLTYLLRKHWGLNSVLNDRNGEGETIVGKKYRDDHRHHAIDAIVIGMTTRSMLQKVSTVAKKGEKLEGKRLFGKDANGKSPIDPWDGFKREVQEVVRNIIVSHRSRRKKLSSGSTDGQLHKDTAYGVISGPNEKGLYKVVSRTPIEKFQKREHFESIRDNRLRLEFLEEFEKNGKEGALKLAKAKGIRSLRCTENLSVILIKDKSSQVYKAYKGDSNWGIEIYEYPDGHKKVGKWEGVVISRFDANKSDFRLGQTKKPHPAARLIMRLHINDCVEIEKKEVKQIMRLQKMSQNGSLDFALHNEANVDSRNRDKDNPFKYLNSRVSSLKSMNARKVHISPTGRLEYENRHGTLQGS